MAERIALRSERSAPDEDGGGSYFAKPKKDMEFFSSGCRTLDMALGGGWAKDRVSNIIGDRSVGKTLLAIEASYHFIDRFPKGRVRYRESERAFQEAYAQALGMPMDRVDLGDDPLDTVEDLTEDIERICKGARGPEFVVVDSLDALSSRAEAARKIGQPSFGGEKAKGMSELFRRMIRAMSNKHVTLMVISQIRDNIGVMFGRKWKRSGGHALDFYSSQTVVLAQRGFITRKVPGIKAERTVGVGVRAKLDKNKVGMPQREAEFSLIFGYGLDDAGACFKWLKDNGGIPANLKTLTSERIDAMLYSGDPKYQSAQAALQRAVEARWWKVETSFLPKRRKYEAHP